RRASTYGLFVGSYLALMLFNICLCITLRERLYFLYALYQMSAFITLCIFSGVAGTWLPVLAANFRLSCTVLFLALNTAVASQVLFST
ncbi:7TM diverse intracellular signaling domain-containing protein, partial [Klebsiella pneumoniae]